MNTENMELRLYCVIRGDLEIPAGKLMVQAGHAFVSAMYKAWADHAEQVTNYMENSQPKIVLKAKNEAALRRAKAECLTLGIPCYLVTDAGRTVFLEPTTTCLGIGPVRKSELPEICFKNATL